jgi:putative endonuclease
MVNEKGRASEEYVVEYLQGQGLEIVETNFTTRYGEIDVIAKKDDLLIIVEVKSFKTKNRLVRPANAVTIKKQEKIKNTANIYLAKNKLSQTPCRFDVVELIWEQDEVKTLNWLKDAFR